MTLFASMPKQPTTDFDAFWSLYPKKVAKGAARKAWRLALKKANAQDITSALVRYTASINLVDMQYIPYPATWLSAERWLEFPEVQDKPVQERPKSRLETVAWAVQRGIHLQSIAPHEIRQCVQAGLISASEANGFMPGVLR